VEEQVGIYVYMDLKSFKCKLLLLYMKRNKKAVIVFHSNFNKNKIVWKLFCKIS